MGWQSSVRSVRFWDSLSCQPQDSTVKIEYNLFLVFCRSTLTGLALNYSVSAPRLCSSLHFFLLSSYRLLQLLCVCVCVRSARCMQRRKIGRKVGAGWQAPTIGCLEVPQSTRYFQMHLYLILLFENISWSTSRIKDLSCIMAIECMLYWLHYECCSFRYHIHIQHRLSTH